MKIKNKKIIIGMIFSILMISSAIVIMPAVKHYLNSFCKKTVLNKTEKDYKSVSIQNKNNDNNISSLIDNLSYVKEYISTTVLQKQKILKLSIVGSHYDKTDISSKHYKESEIGHFNRISLIKKNRYRNQAIATIGNSKNSLEDEDRIISEIIPILKEHPYTYSLYLNKCKLVIPNINFFISNNNSTVSNIWNFKSNSISSNTYNINSSSVCLNSVSLSSEEQVVSAKTVIAAGSSLSKVWFHQINFGAKIITFNKITNNYQYAKATTTNVKYNSKFILSSKNNLFATNNSKISNFNKRNINNLSYQNLNKDSLTVKNSLFDSIPSSIIICLPNVIEPRLPNYFNKHVGVVAKATIKYNNIAAYKHNRLWYDFGAGVSLLAIISIPISFYIVYKLIKKRLIRKSISMSNITRNNTQNILKSFVDIQEHIDNIEKRKNIDSIDTYFIRVNAELDELKDILSNDEFTLNDKRILDNDWSILKLKITNIYQRITDTRNNYEQFNHNVDTLINSFTGINETNDEEELGIFVNSANENITILLNELKTAYIEKEDKYLLHVKLNNAKELLNTQSKTVLNRIKFDRTNKNNNYNTANEEMDKIENYFRLSDEPKTIDEAESLKKTMHDLVSEFGNNYMNDKISEGQRAALNTRIISFNKKFNEKIDSKIDQINNPHTEEHLYNPWQTTIQQPLEQSTEISISVNSVNETLFSDATKQSLTTKREKIVKRRNSFSADTNSYPALMRRNSSSDIGKTEMTYEEPKDVLNLLNLPDNVHKNAPSIPFTVSISQERIVPQIHDIDDSYSMKAFDEEVNYLSAEINKISKYESYNLAREQYLSAKEHLSQFIEYWENNNNLSNVNRNKVLGKIQEMKDLFNSNVHLAKSKHTDEEQIAAGSSQYSDNDTSKILTESEKINQAKIHTNTLDTLHIRLNKLKKDKDDSNTQAKKTYIQRQIDYMESEIRETQKKLTALKIEPEEITSDQLLLEATGILSL